MHNPSKNGLLNCSQKLLVVTSFATVICQISRDKLLNGDGLPFGIAASGFFFDRLSYFCSAAFWGGVIGFRKSNEANGGLVICLISLGGLVATMAGPAIAVLMLPRTTVSLLSLRMVTRRCIDTGALNAPDMAIVQRSDLVKWDRQYLLARYPDRRAYRRIQMRSSRRLILGLLHFLFPTILRELLRLLLQQ